METEFTKIKELFAKQTDPANCYKIANTFRTQLLLTFTQQPNPNASTMLCEITEICALLSLQLQNVSQFDNLAIQLQTFYFDSVPVSHAPSKNSSLLLALILMRLLTSNRFAEFHMLLERVQDWNAVYSDTLISFPVNLEQSLMEGSFRKVLQAVSNAPSPYFEPFNNVVAHAVRVTVANGCQSSFRSLSLVDLGKMLFLGSLEEVMQFVSERNWTVSGDRTKVLFSSDDCVKYEASAYCTQMLLANLGLAREMESII